MRKFVFILVLLLAVVFAGSACGEDEGAGFKYRYAWIALEGQDVAEGYVTWWTTYSDGVVGVEIDGRRYYTSYHNLVLVAMREKPENIEEVRPC